MISPFAMANDALHLRDRLAFSNSPERAGRFG